MENYIFPADERIFCWYCLLNLSS